MLETSILEVENVIIALLPTQILLSGVSSFQTLIQFLIKVGGMHLFQQACSHDIIQYTIMYIEHLKSKMGSSYGVQLRRENMVTLS